MAGVSTPEEVIKDLQATYQMKEMAGVSGSDYAFLQSFFKRQFMEIVQPDLAALNRANQLDALRKYVEQHVRGILNYPPLVQDRIKLLRTETLRRYRESLKTGEHADASTIHPQNLVNGVSAESTKKMAGLYAAAMHLRQQ